MKLRIGLVLFTAIGLFRPVASISQTRKLSSLRFSASGSGVCNWQRLLVDQYNNLYLSFNDESFNLSNEHDSNMKVGRTNWVSVGTSGFTQNFAHHSDFRFLVMVIRSIIPMQTTAQRSCVQSSSDDV